MHEFARWIADTPLGTSFINWLTATRVSVAFEHQAFWAWPLAETIHFFGLCLLLGGAGLFDLRLVGFMKGVPIAAVRRFVPWAVVGFVLNLLTGAYFFVVQPRYYLSNPAWWPKVGFLLVAGLNVLWFERTLGPRIDTLDSDGETPLAFKVAGVVSLVAWLGVLYYGRMLAFIGIN